MATVIYLQLIVPQFSRALKEMTKVFGEKSKDIEHGSF